METKKRKTHRLKGFNYSSSAVYFVTVCVKERKKILSKIVGDGVYDIPKIILSNYGKTAEKYIKLMNSKYENVCVEKYVIMPNHIHLLIHITGMTRFGSSQAPNPTNAIIPKFISLFKRYTNRELGQNIWQRSFYDHIIRDENDYIEHLRYIENNPFLWIEGKDEYSQI